ncbi:YncE family protein [Lentzea sp. NPDC059081]|uniref:YncE family protein n=1 Tax=Lentzea sp. NPDC059081 TaxID=3346719 RepID=UPI0036CE28CC
MHNRSRWLTATAMTAALLSTTLLSATALPAAAEPPQVSVSLALTSFSDIAVDAAHGHVFVSSKADHAVAVTDLSGTAVTKLSNLPGARGLVLSPDGGTVFVALSEYGAIAALDTLTLTERARYPVGEVCPADLAITNGRLYFSYGCTTWGAGIGRVALDGTGARTGLAFGHYSPQQLATTPARPGLLAAAQPSLSPSTLRVLREEGDGLAVQATRDAGSNLADVEFSTDGTQVHAAAGAPYSIQSYTSDTLAVRGSYNTGPYPVAVSTSADTGALAAGTNSTGTSVRIYPAGSLDVSRSYEVPDLHLASLAWGPGGQTVYAVGNRFGQPTQLYVLNA